MKLKGSNRVAMKRTRTKHLGVYELKSETKKHNRKADVCFYVTYKHDGKKIWEKVGWASEGYSAKLASELRGDRVRSIRHGEELPKEKVQAPYFKEVAKKYNEWVEKNKSRSGRDDKYLYKNHLAPAFDDKSLNEISSFDLERLKNKLIKEGYAPGTVKHCLVLIRQIFNKAIQWGFFEGKNPIKGVKLPVLRNQRERFLTYDEANLILGELKNKSEQLHDMALLSLHCGLRAGEIFNLKGQDIDFENELINVADPKNRESRKAYMTNAVKEVLSARKTSSPDEFVFKDKKHSGKINSISQTFSRAVKNLGLNDGITDPRQKITFHSLRHTFASWLALQGETILTIRELLGHKTLDMTMRYAHLIPEQKRRATMNLERLFDEKRNLQKSTDTYQT
jgi:integrase